MTGQRTTTMRLRSVRFKDGRGEIRVLRPQRDRSVDKALQQSVATVAEMTEHSDLCGFALVAWSRAGSTYTNFMNGQASPLTAGQTPQFVHDALLAEMSSRWNRPDD